MRSTRTKNLPGVEIKVTFRRRKLKEYGFLKFDNEEDCYMARMKLGDSLVLKNGERISVKPNKKDNVSLFLSLSIRGLGPLPFLGSERPKDVIEEAVRDRGRSVAKNNKKQQNGSRCSSNSNSNIIIKTTITKQQ